MIRIKNDENSTVQAKLLPVKSSQVEAIVLTLCFVLLLVPSLETKQISCSHL